MSRRVRRRQDRARHKAAQQRAAHARRLTRATWRHWSPLADGPLPDIHVVTRRLHAMCVTGGSTNEKETTS